MARPEVMEGRMVESSAETDQKDLPGHCQGLRHVMGRA
jgi:hypothetical protein